MDFIWIDEEEPLARKKMVIKIKTKILLAVMVIIAPVIVMLIPAIILYVVYSENYFLGTFLAISCWIFGILVGHTLTKQMKKSKTNASKETLASKE